MIINIVVYQYGVPESILTDWDLLFTLKFWFLLCYFLEIKKKLFITFQLQKDGQTERQNNTIKVYLRAFINWEQNNWASLLLIAEFAYNNAKNANIGHTLFELNSGYYLRVLFKEDVDPCSRCPLANKLANELRELIEICCQNLLHTKELKKRANNKEAKSYSYSLDEKV